MTVPAVPHIPLPAGARSALAVIDMQNFFFRLPERRVGLEAVIENINCLIEHFDRMKLPVFHVITCFKQDGSDWDLKMRAWGSADIVEGSEEAAILPQIRVELHHHRLVKTRYSAFCKTDLADQLTGLRIQRLVVAGAYTHYCVNFTVFDAFAYDFVPCVITDAVTSHMPAEADMMLDRMRRNGYHLFTTAGYLAANPA